LDGLIASRQSLAFDWKMPMEPRVDRPELPMELRQLKINRRVIRPKRNKFIGSNVIKMCYLEEGRYLSGLKKLPII